MLSSKENWICINGHLNKLINYERLTLVMAYYHKLNFWMESVKRDAASVTSLLWLLVFDPCYAQATVARARFWAAAFSDGSYHANVNGAYLRHVKVCVVRGPTPFVHRLAYLSTWAATHFNSARLVQSARRRTPASPILVCADPHSLTHSHRSHHCRRTPMSPILV